MIYFSECIRCGREPEPDGWEGLADVRIIQALYRSADTRQAVEISPLERRRRPSPVQEIEKPPVERPELVHTQSPSL